MHTVITGDVWIGPDRTADARRTTAPGRQALAAEASVRLTVAQEEALEEAVDRATEDTGPGLRLGRLGGTPARDAGPAPVARGLWAAAIAVVRPWLTRSEGDRAWEARVEGRREAVRRELLLRQPRLW